MSGDPILEKLELACNQAGSRRAFADKHSINPNTIRKVFCGNRKPTYQILKALGLEPPPTAKPASVEGERWRAVAGYEGLYEVSDHGRVRSLDRICTNRKTNQQYRANGRLLRPGVAGHGYLVVVLSKDGIGKSATVHRLVADAFLPPDPIRTDVNHINSNRADARLCNLERATRSENLKHGHKYGFMTTHVMRGESNTSSVLTDELVRCLRRRAAAGESYEALARELGVHGPTVRRAVIGETWSHVTEEAPHVSA